MKYLYGVLCLLHQSQLKKLTILLQLRQDIGPLLYENITTPKSASTFPMLRIVLIANIVIEVPLMQILAMVRPTLNVILKVVMLV